MKNLVFCLGVALLLSGCGSIQNTLQQMSLVPNAPAGGAGQTVPRTPQMMKAAARATLAAGYTHFKLSDASSGAGTQSNAACALTACRETLHDDGGHLVSQAGLTLTMFHADEPGAVGAFDAKQVIAQYKG